MPGCYRFEFASWRSERPDFQLDTLPRVFRLTNDRLAPSISGVPQFRAFLVRGPTFGDYAPEIQPMWNRITGDSSGFAVAVHDLFSGIHLQVFGADPKLSGSAMIDTDELFRDSTGAFSVVVAKASITASRIECP